MVGLETIYIYIGNGDGFCQFTMVKTVSATPDDETTKRKRIPNHPPWHCQCKGWVGG